MKIAKDERLSRLNTFRIGGMASFFAVVKSVEDLKSALEYATGNGLPVFVLGGGSNILVSENGFDGLVIKMEIKGIEELKNADRAQEQKDPSAATQDERRLLRHDRSGMDKSPSVAARRTDHVFIRAGAGEDWDGFVGWCVERNHCGLENLSFIPGTVGAAPVQNIGAYGIEAGDLIERVEVFDVKDRSLKTISKEECGFSYRDSVFKHEKGRYIIVSVLFKLNKNVGPDISYKDLAEYFNKNDKGQTINGQGRMSDGQKNLQTQNAKLQVNSRFKFSKAVPTILEVRHAVIGIRKAKLPDVTKVGTAGSFFKNPVISNEKFKELRGRYPGLPGFPETGNGMEGHVKVPLAWIIDKICGLKGKRFDAAGIHETQALVIVNYGGASFDDVEKAAKEVERSVKEKTGIDIEREVVIV